MAREWGAAFVLGTVLAFALVGCAADGVRSSSMIGAEPYPPRDLPHRVASSHVELYWKCDAGTPGEIRVEGMARNPWSPQEVRDLEFDLVGVDRDGRAVSDTHAEAPEFLLGTNQVTRFHLSLRTTGREVRYDLFYQYRFQELEEMAALGSAPSARPRMAQSSQRFMVRDACSDTQHRVR